MRIGEVLTSAYCISHKDDKVVRDLAQTLAKLKTFPSMRLRRSIVGVSGGISFIIRSIQSEKQVRVRKHPCLRPPFT